MPDETERILVGRIGVDRARIIVCDPSYIQDQQLLERDLAVEQDQLEALKIAQGQSDREAAEAAYPLFYQLPFLMGHEGAAVVVRSGLGDGFYPVYATVMEVENWGKRVVRLEVDFMDHPYLETVPVQAPDGLEKLLVEVVAFLEFQTDHPSARGLKAKAEQVLKSYMEGKDADAS